MNNNNFLYELTNNDKDNVKEKIQNIQNNIINKYIDIDEDNFLYYNKLSEEDLSEKYNIKLTTYGKLDFSSSFKNFLDNIYNDIKRITYNVFIIHNNNYFQINNEYFANLENDNNFINNIYNPFLNFIKTQLGGDQHRKVLQEKTPRQPGNRQHKKKMKKTNKFISSFYLIIFQALQDSLITHFLKNKTFINDKYQSLRTCVIDFDNYNIIYYQPFLFIDKEKYYVSYIFSKCYIDDNNKIKIDMFSYPFQQNKNNTKILKELTFLTKYSIKESRERILTLFNRNIKENKTEEFNEYINLMQKQAVSFNNQNQQTNNINNLNNNILQNKILLLNI